MKILYFMTFLLVLSGFSTAKAACPDQNPCQQESFQIAQNSGLSSSVIDMIQRQFNGRVISASPGAGCRESTNNINIGGEKVQAYGAVCPGADGSWDANATYDVQVMSDGRVIVVTVSQSGSILKVQQ